MILGWLLGPVWTALMLPKHNPISSRKFIIENDFILQNSVTTFNCFCRSNIFIVTCNHYSIYFKLFYLFKKQF